MRKPEGAGSESFSESQLREIIARAAKMSSQEQRISLAELREIAEELEIDPMSLERSLAEVRHARDGKAAVGRVYDAGSFRDFGRVSLGAVAGSILGASSALLGKAIERVLAGIAVTLGSNAYIDVPVALVLIALSITALRRHRQDGRIALFLAEVFALWGTFYAGWAITNGAPTPDLSSFVVWGLAISGTVGAILIKRGKPAGTGGDKAVIGEEPAGLRNTDPERDRFFTWREAIAVMQLGLMPGASQEVLG